MTKITALFAIPSAVIAALLLVGEISEQWAGGIGLVIVAVQGFVTAYLDPKIPWVGSGKVE